MFLSLSLSLSLSLKLLLTPLLLSFTYLSFFLILHPDTNLFIQFLFALIFNFRNSTPSYRCYLLLSLVSFNSYTFSFTSLFLFIFFIIPFPFYHKFSHKSFFLSHFFYSISVFLYLSFFLVCYSFSIFLYRSFFLSLSQSSFFSWSIFFPIFSFILSFFNMSFNISSTSPFFLLRVCSFFLLRVFSFFLLQFFFLFQLFIPNYYFFHAKKNLSLCYSPFYLHVPTLSLYQYYIITPPLPTTTTASFYYTSNLHPFFSSFVSSFHFL
ncbi:unnamed protein product [Acanthosepion pharaonis]|uniref:Uncharacterized protein n=1 Tax=Acanthosepion pharaonis TaxID=158019 RepID=A0A812BS21_ACAPH|nr:unnamed protein product [Sepia pharaonis]